MRTIIDSVSSLLIMALAVVAIAAYLAVNLMFAEVDSYWAGGCASIPVILFIVACIRNGLRFTVGWSLGLLALTFATFVCYGMDAGVLSFLLAGVVACAWMGLIVFWALAYRPQDGAIGQLLRRGGDAMGGGASRVKGGGGSNLPSAGINLMVALLVANLLVSLMGVMA